MTRNRALFKVATKEKKRLADLLLNSDIIQTEIVKSKMKIHNIEKRLNYDTEIFMEEERRAHF